MQEPQISHRDFMVLATLVDGHEKTTAEIHAEIGWTPHLICLQKPLWRLCGSRLIQKLELIRRTNPPETPASTADAARRLIREMPDATNAMILAEFNRRYSPQIQSGELNPLTSALMCLARQHVKHGRYQPSLKYCVAYAITETGIQAVREVLDFYLFFGTQYGNGSNGDPGKDVVSRRTAPPRNDCRYPTPAEELQIASHASNPEFALLLKAIRYIPVGLEKIMAMNVADVDTGGRTIRIGDKQHRCNRQLRSLLWRSIRDRETGPLFPNPSGKRWKETTFWDQFVKYRTKAGLPRTVTFSFRLRPRPPVTSHRSNGRPPPPGNLTTLQNLQSANVR